MVNALAPAEVVKVVLDETRERIEVVVPDAQLSLAIGRRGQNVRLASQLTGWDIDIMTEQEESERRQKEFADRSKLFIDALDVDEMVGQLLASEGFGSIEELAFVPVEELILAARIKAGWINEADLAPEPTEAEGEEGAVAGEGTEAGGAEAPSGASAS